MTKKFFKKVYLMLLISLVFSASIFLVSCIDTYRIESSLINCTLEYNSDLPLDDITILKNNGEAVNITKDMIMSQVDGITSTVGNKQLVVKYGTDTFTIYFTVKYKVKFMVDDEVVSTQYVLNKDEIVFPQDPEKLNFDFVGWGEIPEELNDNLELNAQFAVSSVQVPLLSSISATYGDTLQSIDLPSNEYGCWQFVDDLSTSVGNAGVNNFEVKFVPTDENVVVNKISNVTINVAKKQLEFRNVVNSFDYDGSEKLPQYDLDLQGLNVQYTPYYAGQAINVGEYVYELDIIDSNYTGSYYGRFVINAINAKIYIDDVTIKFTDDRPETYSYRVTDASGNELSQEIIDLMDVSIIKPNYVHTGSYEISAKADNKNFNVSVIKGYLNVTKVEYEVENPGFVNGRKVVYGNLLNTVEFSNSDIRGTWQWEQPNLQVLTHTSFVATAVFVPEDDKNYLTTTKEIELSVEKRKLEIIPINNIYTYDGASHTIEYDIDGVVNYDYVQIVGNRVEITAGEYAVELKVAENDPRYIGGTEINLVINKASMNPNFDLQYNVEWSNTLVSGDINLPKCYSWYEPNESLRDYGISTVLCKVVYTPEDTTNYKVEEGLVNINIIKANKQIDSLDNYEFTYSPNGYTLLGIELPHNESLLQFKYVIDGVEVDNITNVGDYEVELYLPESAHYNAINKKVSIKVNKAENKDEIIQTLDAVYGDYLSEFILPISTTGKWSWSSNDCVGNVGRIIHFALFTPYDDINYESRIVPVEFNIAKKLLPIPTISSQIYNGTNLTANISDTTEYRVVQNNGGVNVGSYPVQLMLIDSNNYAWKNSEDNKTIDINFEIIKNNNNAWLVNPSIGSWTYGQIAKDAKASSMFGDVVVEYKLKTDTDAMYLSDKPSKAGEYVARFSVADTDDFVGIEATFIEFNIDYIVVNIPTISDKMYNGEPQSATIASSDYYSVVKNDAVTNAGKYGVVLRLNNDSYKWSDSYDLEKSLVFVIRKVDNTDNIITIYNATYKDTLSKFELFDSATGVWTWQEDENTEVGNAGTAVHIVKFTPNDPVNYETRLVEVLFNIDKKMVQLPVIDAKTYNGERQIATISDTNYYVVVENNGGIKTGDYDVVLELTDFSNYRWAGEQDSKQAIISFNIVRFANNIWEITPSINDWVYGSTSSEPVALATYGDFVVEYKSKSTDDSTYSTTKPNKAGKYIARFKIQETDDYNGLSQLVEFEIGYKIIQTPVISESVYSGKEQVANIPVSEYYDVVYNNPVLNAGNYNVIIRLNNDSYKWVDSYEAEKVLVFVVNKVKNTDDITTNMSATYKDTLSKHSLPKSATGTWVWKEDASTEVGVVGTAKYIAQFVPTDSINYEAREVEILFNIYKKVVNLPVIESLIYNGEEQYATVAESDIYEVSKEGKGTIAGDYDIELTLKDSDNYCWATNNDNKETIVKFSIIKNNSNDWKNAPSIANWTYLEDSSEPVATAIFGDFVVEYKLKSASDATYSKNMPTEAGEYIAKFSVDDTDSYNGITKIVDFVINHKIINIPTIESKMYNGNVLLPDIENEFVTLVTTNGFVDAGVYSVDIALNNSSCKWPDSYDMQRTISFEITKATDNAWASGPIMNNFDYSPQVDSSNFGTATAKYGNVQVTYSQKDIDDYTENLPVIVGAYKAKFVVNETDNYNGITKILEFSINQATPVLTNTNVGSAYETASKSVIDANLKANVSGSFSYELPRLVTTNNVAEESTNFEVTFNPTDSHNYKSITATATITLKVVCYIDSTYYGSIENAIVSAVSGNNIMVKPDTSGNVTIANNVTILSGVTLTLPYAETNGVNKNNKSTLTSDDVENFSSMVLTNQVVVLQNVTITNNGTIMIAGELSGGSGGHGSAGHTARKHAELEMQENAKIISNGTITCYGLIDVSSDSNVNTQVIIKSGTLTMPFVMNDFRGGNFMKEAYTNQTITPFNQFEFRNIVPKLRVENGGSLIGNANLYASYTHNNAQGKIIGNTSDYLIQLKDGAYIEAKYNPDRNNVDDNKWTKGVCDLNMYGGAISNSLALKVSGINISTSTVAFPLTWRFNITLHSGEYTMNNLFKMLPGHKFTVESDASLTASSIHVYSEFNDVMGIAPKYDTGLPGAKFILRGSLTATTFGGRVYSDTDNATINVTNTSVSTNEMTSLTKVSDGLFGSSFGAKYSATVQTITDSLTLYSAQDIDNAINNNSFVSTVAPTASTKYKLVDGKWVVA